MDLGRPDPVREIVFDTGVILGDYPRGYTVSVSSDGTSWSTALTDGMGIGQLTVVPLSGAPVRFVRMTLTASNASWWSVADVRAYAAGGRWPQPVIPRGGHGAFRGSPKSRAASCASVERAVMTGDEHTVRMGEAEVIVVGLGAMGSAACSQLAARGVSVIGIDQYAPPHPWGSTHGDTRVTREAIGEGREYVPLARRSHHLWREIERETGAQLLTRCGIVVLAHASSEFLAETRASARAYEVEHRDLTNADLRSAFPMFTVEEEIVAYYEPGAGYVRPEAAVAAQLDLARARGAQLRLGERVETWTASRYGVTVSTEANTYQSDQLLLCPGAWIGDLFPEGREIFAVYRQLLYWFPIRQGYAQLRDMPGFVWDLGGRQDEVVHLDGFYGLPAIDGPGGGMKVAAESYERTAAPDGRQHPATRGEIDRMYEQCIAPHLPWLGPEPLRTISCLYTSTRGSRFVIDRHPEHDSVLIVSACSGHGFKHSPAIGEAVAQWLTGDRPEIDVTPFGLSSARG